MSPVYSVKDVSRRTLSILSYEYLKLFPWERSSGKVLAVKHTDSGCSRKPFDFESDLLTQ